MKLSRLWQLPFVGLVYMFLYVPLVVLVVFSFNTERFPAPWKEFTWHWYQELFHSPFLWESFQNSIIVAVSSTAISLLLGVLLLFWAFQESRVDRWLAFFYGNLVIPETVLAVSLLGFFTFSGVPLGFTTLIIAHSVLGLGFVIPILYAKYQELDARLTEASLDLGATSLQTFRKIILPLLTPTIIAVSLLVFVISFDDFILSYFCAGSSSQTLSLYIFSMIRIGVSPVVNALSTLLLVLSSTFVLIFFSLRTKTRIF